MFDKRFQEDGARRECRRQRLPRPAGAGPQTIWQKGRQENTKHTTNK